ncbi:MAG: SDR family NAD(P)-dependent oxidoreductase, partial [Dehalococcoidia bacterium]|nr:SDR family NAD(P)-dependent oxidoreductase [Dehalococcoidia bacterium]
MGMMDGRVAIITGAGRGIGRAAAEMFSEEGADIVICELDAGPAEETAELVRKNGRRAIVCAGNLVEPGLPEQIMAATAKEFGRLDILVNNAGYTADGVIHRMSDSQFQAMLDIHLVVPFRMIRAASPLMRDVAKKELEDGIIVHRKIVNVSSVNAWGQAGQINYSAAKMGILGLTKAVAKEWASFNIHCNAVCYGGVETRLTGSKEAGESVMGYAVGLPQAMLDARRAANPTGRRATVREAASGIFYLASP